MYNGIEPFPDVKTIRLSELYEKPQDLGLTEKIRPLLELEVKVININEGKNEAIVNRCKMLAEYSAFIARIRSFWKELGDKEAGTKEAIKYCSKHGILKPFLEVHGSEVLNMIFLEWNTEDAIAFAREEGREEGREEIARSALAEGATLEFVQKITGLDLEAIQRLNV